MTEAEKRLERVRALIPKWRDRGELDDWQAKACADELEAELGPQSGPECTCRTSWTHCLIHVPPESPIPDLTGPSIIEENLAAIGASQVFLSLYHESMANFREDPLPAIQLAIAILLDKPIVVAVVDDRPIPDKLRRLADRVIQGSEEAVLRGIEEYVLDADTNRELRENADL